MHAALPALSPPRRRALALMGVDVWVLRARDAEPEAVDAGSKVAEAASAAPRFTDGVPRVVFVADGATGFDGPAGTLLRHLALALGLAPSTVVFGAPREDLPCVCFGAAPGGAPDALLAPPLATLRASARARRALWPDLRALARRLRG